MLMRCSSIGISLTTTAQSRYMRQTVQSYRGETQQQCTQQHYTTFALQGGPVSNGSAGFTTTFKQMKKGHKLLRDRSERRIS